MSETPVADLELTEIRLKQYQLLAEKARDVILFIRPSDGQIVEGNDAALLTYGYTLDELRKRTIHDLRAPATRALVGAQMGLASATGILFETIHQRHDGSTFPVEVSSVGVATDGVLLSIIRDITERKRLHDRLAQAVAIGSLTAGVVHEISTPLTVVHTNLALALQRLERSGNASEGVIAALQDARRASEQMATIVRSARALSAGDDCRRTPVDVRSVLDDALRMVAHELRHRTSVERDYHEVPLVLASEAQLGQVFVNLIVNAAQAMPDREMRDNHLRLSTRSTAHGVEIEVRDDGAGIPPDVLERIFEPFFTTKPVGVGTGLGLPVSHAIVAALGGDIAVESEQGRGTTVRVTLPPLA